MTGCHLMIYSQHVVSPWQINSVIAEATGLVLTLRPQNKADPDVEGLRSDASGQSTLSLQAQSWLVNTASHIGSTTHQLDHLDGTLSLHSSSSSQQQPQQDHTG